MNTQDYIIMSKQNTTFDLSTHMVTCLCDLYSQSGGQVGVVYPSPAHWNVIEGLFRRGLIHRDVQIENGKTVRYIALTDEGAIYSCEKLEVGINALSINAERPRKCVSMFFEMEKPDHADAYERVQELKSMREFRPTTIELLNMSKELDNGQIGLLIKYYPEAVQALRDTIRLEIESEIKATTKTWIKEAVQDAMNNAPQSPQKPQISGLDSNGGQVGLKPVGIAGAGLGGNSFKFSPPPIDDEDDDDIVLDIKKDTSTNANLNFINSLKALQKN